MEKLQDIQRFYQLVEDHFGVYISLGLMTLHILVIVYIYKKYSTQNENSTR